MTYPAAGKYACQPKAWMDEALMNEWIDVILIAWKQTTTPVIVPLLILDEYRVHMMGSIVNRIQSLGIEVQHIPAGCTYLCQPVDIGINRPIKKAMMEQWKTGCMLVAGSQKAWQKLHHANWLLNG